MISKTYSGIYEYYGLVSEMTWYFCLISSQHLDIGFFSTPKEKSMNLIEIQYIEKRHSPYESENAFNEIRRLFCRVY